MQCPFTDSRFSLRLTRHGSFKSRADKLEIPSNFARSMTIKHFSNQEVLPLQPAWLHAQSMSGVFSIAAHSVLQYLPEVASQV
jgi:hypothetical protein